eukprot:TRINITY_DN57627_c0_g1_i1.p1 TRINITY_DN57627_c0_g1~~TRINITY_DN57627_c0_g1_i1.p1  ORF type:complete len:702 (+),score=127.80 TRINITY_DN57627_c0_g1_i1:52-2157(+)
MGSAASTELTQKLTAATPEELKSVVNRLSPGCRAKLVKEIDAMSDGASTSRNFVSRKSFAICPAVALSMFWRDSLEYTGDSIPILKPDDICIVNQAAKKFPRKGEFNPWLGKMTFTVCGQTWTLDSFIGAGAFGQSYLATYEVTGQRYVLKFLQRDDDPELNFLKQVPHKVFEHTNVVTYAGIASQINKSSSSWEPAKHIVFMEAIPNGEVFDLITAQDAQPLSEGTVRRMVHDVINGMAELCKHGITHRDLKPDNLLVDENGHIVIIDLGSAKKVDMVSSEIEGNDLKGAFGMVDADVNDKIEEPEVPVKEEKGALSLRSLAVPETPTSPFMRVQTQAIGTDLYHAPEHFSKRTYDSERADVFTVGILAFLFRQPFPPFHPYFGGYEKLTEDGMPADWWRAAEFSNFHKGAEDLKGLINCLWQRNPLKRPTFQKLKAAMCGDAAVLAEYPALRWLAGPLSEPLEFVLELRAHRPNLSLKCTGVVEALALFVRECEGPEAAFAKAKGRNSGGLTADELTDTLAEGNDAVTPESTADLMRRYMDKDAREMSVAQFTEMAMAWQFGGRPIVHDIGRMNSRHFAFLPRSKDAPEKEQLEALAKDTESHFSSMRYEISKLESEADFGEVQEAKSFTVTMGNQICQLRVSVFCAEGKLVIESRRLWGSSVEELLMLQGMNDDLVSTWGARVEPPSTLAMAPALSST